MKKMFAWLAHSLMALGLTVLSQLGGLAYLGALVVGKMFGRSGFLLFAAFYAGLWVSAAFIAPAFGRVPLACGFSGTSDLRMQSMLYCGLNRHYVSPEMKELALDLAEHMAEEYPGTVTLALDGNFPFFKGVPLLPHLSHNDGRKLDLAFYYSKSGETKSPIGYWVYEGPKAGEAQPCLGQNGPSLR